MASISNNMKFWLPVNRSGDLAISGHATSQAKITIYLIFDSLNPKIPRKDLTLLPEGNWSLPIHIDENNKTYFSKTVRLPSLAGKNVAITVRIPPESPPINLLIDQWSVNGSVFVHGGCISRDAFESADAPPLADYRARSSLVSAFNETPNEIPESALEANPSSFQRRMLRTDINSELPQILSSDNFDFFLIDLIVERTGLAQTESGGIVTLSPEFIKTGLDTYIATKLDVESQQYYDAFTAAWKKLVSIVGESRILVNRVYWASKYVNGDPIANPRQSDVQNERLDRLYSIIQSVSPNINWLNYSTELLRADSNHKWGPAPYHFGKDFYQAQREAIHSTLTSSMSESTGETPPVRLPAGIPLDKSTEITFLEPFRQATFKFLLSVGAKALRNNALLSFELFDVDGTPLSGERNIDGLLFSNKPDIGWFVYVQTLPGTTAWQKSISLPEGITCRKAKLCRWGSDSAPIVVTDTINRVKAQN